MTIYVALLRGINVGGRVLRTEDLMSCFNRLGFQDVKTYLQSGNVVFKSEVGAAELKPLIVQALSSSFHYKAKVLLHTLDNLRAVVNNYPFTTASSEQHDYVIFIENDLENDLLHEDYNLAIGEKVELGPGVVYWRVNKGSTLTSSFGKLLTKTKYKDFNTNRNLRTLKKVVLAN